MLLTISQKRMHCTCYRCNYGTGKETILRATYRWHVQYRVCRGQPLGGQGGQGAARARARARGLKKQSMCSPCTVLVTYLLVGGDSEQSQGM